MTWSLYPSASELIQRLEREARRPVAFQALWDGDTEGWMVCFEGVFHGGASYFGSSLVTLRFGGDLRLFQGAVPLWPEAVVASELGESLARHFGVPFWFPSSTEPDDDCAPWWERAQAVPCADCDKPLARDRVSRLASGVCHPCSLRRERAARLRRDTPASPEGVQVLVGAMGQEQNVQYSSSHTYVRVARFALAQLGERCAEPLRELTLEGALLERFEQELVAEARQLLARWNRQPKKKRGHMSAPVDVLFEGTALTLDLRFDEVGAELHRAICDLETTREALARGHRYWLVFRTGMTERGDRLVRLMRRLDGPADVALLFERSGGALTPEEIALALRQLEGLGHVRGVPGAAGECFELTATGRHV